jgi:hypothetical protein
MQCFLGTTEGGGMNTTLVVSETISLRTWKEEAGSFEREVMQAIGQDPIIAYPAGVSPAEQYRKQLDERSANRTQCAMIIAQTREPNNQQLSS